MKKMTMGEKLRMRRESLELTQYYIAVKIGVTQGFISSLEQDKVKFSPQLIRSIKEIEGFHDFDIDLPEEEQINYNGRSIYSMWPFGRSSFIIAVLVIGILIINQIITFVNDAIRGVSASEPDADGTTYIIVGILVLIIALILYRIVYWLVFKKKWKKKK